MFGCVIDLAWVCLATALAATSGGAQTKSIAERLGYAPDAKLLIIHADDLAVAHSVDDASFAALESGAVTSASVMVPCPWLTEVADWGRSHPGADLGLHLTLTSEWKTYRWGPLAPHDQVPTLLSPDGYFWPDVAPVAQHGVRCPHQSKLENAVKEDTCLHA